MEFLRFLPEGPRLIPQIRHGLCNHPKKEFCLTGFALGNRDLMSEISLRYGIIGLAVIGANAGARTNELINEASSHRIHGNPLGEIYDGFSKYGCSLF